jgi:hypothetical protein
MGKLGILNSNVRYKALVVCKTPSHALARLYPS